MTPDGVWHLSQTGVLRLCKTEKKSGPGLVIKSEEKRLVFGEVSIPFMMDTDDEVFTPDEIEKAAHNFMLNRRVDKIDVQHNEQESGCLVVESFIVRKFDPDGFIEGSWVLGVKVLPDQLWEQVKKGELNGFSLFGRVLRTPAKATVKMIKQMSGRTEPSTCDGIEEHTHMLVAQFDTKGSVIPTYTEVEAGHSHLVLKASATADELGHSHRIITR